MLTRTRPTWRKLGITAALFAMAVTVSVANPAPATAEVAIPAPDGLSQATAAASCWEIKQLTPSAPSGVYWLSTPALGAPDQFYCDQATNGGGWVLVGRGRDGWTESNLGFGTSEQVRASVTGQAAFAPRQLSSETVEGLLNGGKVSALADGIRLRRALDVAGSAWQEATFKFASPRDTWTWAFYNRQRVSTYTIDGVTGTGGFTQDFGTDTAFRRIRTITAATEGWANGFGYGTTVRGSNAADSYLWAKDAVSGGARPFTQVYLRPTLSSAGLYPSATSATPARTREAVAESMAMPTVWGVAGLGTGAGSTTEGSNEVSAFTETGGNVYVGGNFTRVQRTSAGGSQQPQAYLAAFNRSTGEWVSTFRPTFNNQIKSLTALPNNRIAAGGYFTEVNGTPRAGLVVLNATTGAIDTAFTGRLLNYLSGQSVKVLGLDVQDGWLYASGAFTHSTGGTRTQEVYTRAAARFAVTNGTPDTWNPEFNGTTMAVDASDRGDRAYFAGYFTTSRTTPAPKGAAIDTTTAAALAWAPKPSSSERSGYQQAVKEVGDRVWLGGSEHNLFSYNRGTLALESTNIGQRGGDFQAIAADGNTLYAGCHCFDGNYSGSSTWPDVGTQWTSMDKINSTGAWSTTTAAYKRQFSPMVNMRNGAGAWALFVDSGGNLWTGGDFTHSTRAGFVKQWSGGFIRFAPTDTSAPTTPANPSAAETATGEVAVRWSASTDNRGPVSYQVLRNGQVVATSTALTVTLPGAPATTRYAVRAVDPTGNWSASTTPITATPAPPPPPPPAPTAQLIAAGSTWSYSFGNGDPTAGWQAPGFDASGWATGPAPLGWGHSSLGTTLTTTLATKPLASFHRSSITIADAGSVQSVKITTRADDGIVLYVNGTEVLRRNISAGAVNVGTYANVAVSASSAVANPIEVVVPASLFRTGENVISASVHSNYRSTPSHSFELTAVATLGTQP